jgi:hypothetical protein
MRMKKKRGDFVLTLTMDNDVYEADGASIMDVLKKVKPRHFKARGFFRLEHKGKVAVARLSGLKLQRIFSKEADRALLTKRLQVSL